MNVLTQNLEINLGPAQTVRIKNLEISTGQKILISGASGCGKTSLLHTLSLIKPAQQLILKKDLSAALRK